MKFTTGKHKQILFGFGRGGLWADEYIRVVGHPHPGVDYSNGWGSPVYSDNFGIVYKVIKPNMSPSGWCGVYYLCPSDEYGWVEVCQGHLSHVAVKVGQVVREGTIVGLEGNKGEVYSNGERITKAMQEAGDKRGHHVHEQYRPVRQVRKVKSGKHYLNDASGARYRDADGYYYEIIFDNETKGCINPYTFVVEKGGLASAVVNKLLNILKI